MAVIYRFIPAVKGDSWSRKAAKISLVPFVSTAERWDRNTGKWVSKKSWVKLQAYALPCSDRAIKLPESYYSNIPEIMTEVEKRRGE